MNSKRLASAVSGTILKVIVTILVVMVIYKGAITAYDYGYRIFMEPAMSSGEGREVTVTLKEGMSPMEMGDMMVSKGLSRDARLFALQYLFSEFRKEVAPGTYELSTAMTAEEIFEAMIPVTEEEEEK